MLDFTSIETNVKTCVKTFVKINIKKLDEIKVLLHD